MTLCLQISYLLISMNSCLFSAMVLLLFPLSSIILETQMANTARVRIAGIGARCCEQQDSVPRWVLGGDRGLQDTHTSHYPTAHTLLSPANPSKRPQHSKHAL